MSSCKSKEIIQPIHPEIYKVNTCIASDDIAGLINLYHEITEHKDYAYLSIFCDFDIREYNYEKLLDLYNIAKEDSLLKEGFEIIIEEREDFIINELINTVYNSVRMWAAFSAFSENKSLRSTKANKRYAIAEIPLSIVFTISKSDHKYIDLEVKRKKIPAESIINPQNK